MTENPLYRRVYGYDNPLMQQPIFRPPSNEYAVRYNRNPNAAQDLRNLFGTFFAQNYAPQYQPSPYQTTPPINYNSYATSNISPAQQEINQRIGDALHSYTPPQPPPYEKTYQEPRYSTYKLGTPQANYYAQAAPEARNAMYDFAIKQGIPMFITGVTTGGLGYGLGSVARPYIPYALARLGATRYGKSIADGISRFAETPVGNFVGKVADFIF